MSDILLFMLLKLSFILVLFILNWENGFTLGADLTLLAYYNIHRVSMVKSSTINAEFS